MFIDSKLYSLSPVFQENLKEKNQPQNSLGELTCKYDNRSNKYGINNKTFDKRLISISKG